MRSTIRRDLYRAEIRASDLEHEMRRALARIAIGRVAEGAAILERILIEAGDPPQLRRLDGVLRHGLRVVK